jgi:hypothetical protein
MNPYRDGEITDEELYFWLSVIECDCNRWNNIQWWRKVYTGVRVRNKNWRLILTAIVLAMVMLVGVYIFAHATNQVFPGFDLLIGGALVALIIAAILVGT